METERYLVHNQKVSFNGKINILNTTEEILWDTKNIEMNRLHGELLK